MKGDVSTINLTTQRDMSSSPLFSLSSPDRRLLSFILLLTSHSPLQARRQNNLTIHGNNNTIRMLNRRSYSVIALAFSLSIIKFIALVSSLFLSYSLVCNCLFICLSNYVCLSAGQLLRWYRWLPNYTASVGWLCTFPSNLIQLMIQGFHIY